MEARTRANAGGTRKTWCTGRGGGTRRTWPSLSGALAVATPAKKERAPHKEGHYGDVETEIGRSVGALAIVAKQAGAGSEVDKR